MNKKNDENEVIDSLINEKVDVEFDYNAVRERVDFSKYEKKKPIYQSVFRLSLIGSFALVAIVSLSIVGTTLFSGQNSYFNNEGYVADGSAHGNNLADYSAESDGSVDDRSSIDTADRFNEIGGEAIEHSESTTAHNDDTEETGTPSGWQSFPSEGAQMEWDSDGVQTARLGSFYSLSDAYDNGWLTKENIMCISYYCTDKVREVTGRNEKGEITTQIVDYTPDTSAPSLDEITKRDIRYSYYAAYPLLVEYNG